MLPIALNSSQRHYRITAYRRGSVFDLDSNFRDCYLLASEIRLLRPFCALRLSYRGTISPQLRRPGLLPVISCDSTAKPSTTRSFSHCTATSTNSASQHDSTIAQRHFTVFKQHSALQWHHHAISANPQLRLADNYSAAEYGTIRHDLVAEL